MNLPDPSRPLLKNTYELFCQERSKGRDLSASWGFANNRMVDEKSSNSLKVSAVRISQRPEVKNRIDFLIQQKRLQDAAIEAEHEDDIPTVYDRQAIVALSLEITEALEQALEKAVTSSISQVKINQLKNCLSSHLARQAKMGETFEGQVNAPIRGDIMPQFTRYRDCKC